MICSAPCKPLRPACFASSLILYAQTFQCPLIQSYTLNHSTISNMMSGIIPEGETLCLQFRSSGRKGIRFVVLLPFSIAGLRLLFCWGFEVCRVGLGFRTWDYGNF